MARLGNRNILVLPSNLSDHKGLVKTEAKDWDRIVRETLSKMTNVGLLISNEEILFFSSSSRSGRTCIDGSEMKLVQTCASNPFPVPGLELSIQNKGVQASLGNMGRIKAFIIKAIALVFELSSVNGKSIKSSSKSSFLHSLSGISKTGFCREAQKYPVDSS